MPNDIDPKSGMRLPLPNREDLDESVAPRTPPRMPEEHARMGLTRNTVEGAWIEFAARQMGGDPSQQREAPMVVAPVQPVRVDVWISRTAVQKGRVYDVGGDARGE